MNETAKSLHSDKIRAAAGELTEKGYRVLIEPSRQDLPFDLGTYTPDLVAIKDGEGIILEVKVNHGRVSVDRLQELAERVRSHQGWRFMLVTLDDTAQRIFPDGEGDLPSWSEMGIDLAKVQTLVNEKMLNPALLYLWSIVEAMLRKRAIVVNLPIERFPSQHLLSHMYSSGEISMSEFDLFKALNEKRNKAAHGMVTTLDVNELAEALNTTQNLLEKWR